MKHTNKSLFGPWLNSPSADAQLPVGGGGHHGFLMLTWFPLWLCFSLDITDWIQKISLAFAFFVENMRQPPRVISCDWFFSFLFVYSVSVNWNVLICMQTHIHWSTGDPTCPRQPTSNRSCPLIGWREKTNFSSFSWTSPSTHAPSQGPAWVQRSSLTTLSNEVTSPRWTHPSIPTHQSSNTPADREVVRLNVDVYRHFQTCYTWRSYWFMGSKLAVVTVKLWIGDNRFLQPDDSTSFSLIQFVGQRWSDSPDYFPINILTDDIKGTKL